MERRGMKFGIFLAPFHRVGDNPTLALARDLELIELLDDLGYDEAWIGEHHSAGWEIIAAPELVIAAAAERTKHIKLGSGVTSLPYHHPFLVAQRWVQLDLANLDASRGYHPAFTYWRSKKANVYFAVHLQRRAAAAGVALRSMASIPGYAVSNVLTGGANAGRGRLWHSTVPLLNRFLAKPTIEGTWSALYAATVPDLPGDFS